MVLDVKNKSKKSAVKQYIKYALQKTLLPLCYNIDRRKPVDSKLVLFADSNSSVPPESMTALMDELEKRGYVCEPHCCDFSKAGFAQMIKFMCRFMNRYAQARAVVVCNYFVPLHACNKRPETCAVQLWHSCGAFKKFGYSSESDISKHFHGSVAKNIDLVTVSSPLCESVFAEAFRLSDGVAKATGVCRTDKLTDKAYTDLCRSKLYKAHPELEGKKLLLYLPTFRGDAGKAYSVGHEEIYKLDKALGDEWFTAVRMHPRIKNGRCDLCDMTTNELLPCADMLITDYSSAVFEFSLFDKPMLLWCPDLEEYTAQRDFYLDLRRDMPCPVVTEAEKLGQAVRDEYEGFKSGAYSEFREKYMSSCDGKATSRVANFIET